MKKVSIIIFLCVLSTLSSQIANDQHLKEIYDNARAEENDFIGSYELLANEHTDSYYGQLALLELAKINILKRNYEEAVEYLKKIHLAEIRIKQYWLAKAYLKSHKYQLSIISAQIFIAESNDFDKIEIAYFIIAEGYIEQKMFQRAYNTLETLRTSKYIKNNIPLLHFKMGYCKEFLGKYEDALIHYKNLRQNYPYHKYSYIAEDRIYNMRSGNKIDMDVTKINFYRSIEPEEESKAATGRDLKIYVQIGAFGSKENAEKLGKKIARLKYKYIIFPKIKNNNKLYVVAVGPFKKGEKLKNAIKKLEENDFKTYVIKRY